MRLLVFRSQDDINPLLDSSWVESPTGLKDDNQMWSKQQIPGNGPTRSDRENDQSENIKKQLPSTTTSPLPLPPPLHHDPLHHEFATSPCPSLLRSRTRTGTTRKRRTRTTITNSNNPVDTELHHRHHRLDDSPTSSCCHVSFNEQVDTVLIPKLESHQVMHFFYDADDLNMFRNEVAKEKLHHLLQEYIVVDEDEEYYYEEVIEEEEEEEEEVDDKHSRDYELANEYHEEEEY